MSKLVGSIREAIEKAGLKDGMTISFHHHMRNGDYVLNMVLAEAAAMGIRDLTVNASSIFDIHEPIIEHIKNGVVTQIECNYMGGKVGKAISQGIMEKPVIFRTHGGRAGDMENGSSKIDIAFLAAPCADDMGNLSGKYGPSACGSLGYAFSDAMYAKKVVAVTDHLVPYPLRDASIEEGYVDYVVQTEQIGDPARIVSGTTKITRDPVGLRIAGLAAQVVKHSGYLKDGFSFQTGAGGASLAVAKYVEEMMEKDHIKGSFCMGGITGYMVDMLNEGCFEALLDVQCFDLKAVESIRTNPKHMEVSATQYAGVSGKIRLHLGDAAKLLPEENAACGTYDFAFIDANKREYLEYYEMVLPLLRPGGVLVADDVLWDGKVYAEPVPSDAQTAGLVRFNDFVAADPRVEVVILPLRDGLSVIRKN